MQTQYDNLKVSSPAPGHYIIDGLPAGSTQTEEGRLVHPMSVHIPPSLPSGLLLEIIRDRGEPMTLNELGTALEAMATTPPLVVEGELEGVKDSGEFAEKDFVPAPPGSVALSLVVGALIEKGGNMRIKELSEVSGIEIDIIKSLDGQGFELGAAGWVKLKEGGEA